MHGSGRIIATGIALIVLFSLLSLSATTVSAALLTSQFLGSDTNALQVMGGTPYAMNDPAWNDGNYDQNKNTFAYKLYAGSLDARLPDRDGVQLRFECPASAGASCLSNQ